MLVMTRHESLREPLPLPAGDSLAFVDAASGKPVVTGLRCSLVLRHGGRLLGRSSVTPAGLHLWPNLPERWREPQVQAFADVVVRDEQQRFQPLSLPWPLSARPVGQIIGGTVLGSSRLVRVGLFGAPARRAPPGATSVYGLLVWEADGAPAAWARVRLIDREGRAHEGASDAEGRLGLHLPRSCGPVAELRVHADPAMGAASLGLGAPDVLAFARQPAARALAHARGNAMYVPATAITGEPLILATQGLPPAYCELRLVPA
ncbi:hypothetical protein [Roseateles sp.]|uniref:hypothetical protein n=1 Tax=Roseateles sp. TaxID=1971397 RepID=UPI0039EC1D56